MGFNKGKIKVKSSAKKKTSPWSKDVLMDPAGQWKYPGQITKVPSRDITMKGVNYPVLGVDEFGNEQMMMPNGEYQFPGNMVTEYPMMQTGGEAQQKAYAKYQDNIRNKGQEYLGQKFRTDISMMPDAEGFDPGGFNCIGGACNFTQGMGADVPIIPGNSSFWNKAQTGQIPVKVYSDSSADDYEKALEFLQPGDYIGHDIGKGGGKNLYYPEHTNTFLRWEENPFSGKKVAVMMDANSGEDHSYEERRYNYNDLVNPAGKRLFFGRPTSVGGQKLDFNYPGDDTQYFKNIPSAEELANVTVPQWKVNKEYEGFADINEDKRGTLKEITNTLSNRKKDFIGATGMSSEDYDKIASVMPGLANQESMLGDTLGIRGAMKHPLLSGKEALKTAYGSLFNKEGASRGLFQVRHKQLFNNSATKKALKKLGITEDNYDPRNTEHNTLASMVLMNDNTKGLDKRWAKAKTKEGLVANSDLSLEEKLLYLYSSPGRVRKGQAQGDSNYVRNVTDFDAVYPQTLVDAPVSLPELTIRKLGGTSPQNIKNNVMNLPEGYHMMPDGTVMLDSAMEYRRGGQPCYECGGGIPHAKNGMEIGSSQAPQNSTIDGIGKQRVDLMQNFLAANNYKSMLDKEAESLKQTMNYFDNGGESGSFYNPNVHLMKQYQNNINNQQKQFGKDWKAFTGAIGDVAANVSQNRPAAQPFGQPQGVPTAMDAMPNQGFGSAQPDTFGRNVDRSFGQNQPGQSFFAYGGDLPKAQYGPPEVPLGTTREGLSYMQAALQDRAQRERNQNYTANPVPLNYGQQLRQQVGQPNSIMLDMYPDASSAEGVTPGINWNDYNAEQARLKQLIALGYQPTAQDMTRAEIALPPYMAAQKAANEAQANATVTPTRNKELPTLTAEQLKNVKNEADYHEIALETNKKNNTTSKGKNNTPTAQEIEAVENEINKTDKTDDAVVKTTERGNYNDPKKDNKGDARTYNTTGQNYYQQPDNRKYKARGYTIDPVTGKKQRFRFKSKPGDANRPAYGPNGGRMPRKVKNTFNFYNGELQGNTPAEAQRGPDMEYVARKEYTGMPYTPPTIPNPNLEVEKQPGTFSRRSEDVAPMSSAETDAYYKRVNEAKIRQMAQDYMSTLPQQAFGGQPMYNVGGPTLDDSVYTADPNYDGSYVGDDGALMVDKQWQRDQKRMMKDQQTGQLKTKSKEQSNFMNNAGQYAPLILPGVDMVSSIFESRDAARNAEDLQRMKSADNVFSVNTYTNRGKNTANQGYFDPSNMVPVQFQGNNQGSPGSYDTFARYGGQPHFTYGGEYELDENQIAQFLAAGGQIEYI